MLANIAMMSSMLSLQILNQAAHISMMRFSLGPRIFLYFLVKAPQSQLSLLSSCWNTTKEFSECSFYIKNVLQNS